MQQQLGEDVLLVWNIEADDVHVNRNDHDEGELINIV